MSLIHGSRTLLKSSFERLGFKVQRLAPNQVRGITPLEDINFLIGRKSAPTIFDVGANDGETVSLFLRTFPGARIIAFEPFTGACEKLRQRFNGQSVRIENVALGEFEGEALLNLYSGDRMNSLLELNGNPENPMKGYSKTGDIPVKIRTLDTFCQSNAIGAVDVLKIDTQGYDLNVLKGGLGLLKQQRVKTVLLEINFVPMYERQADFVEIHTLLSSCGYRLVAFYNHLWKDGCIAWCDACYVAV